MLIAKIKNSAQKRHSTSGVDVQGGSALRSSVDDVKFRCTVPAISHNFRQGSRSRKELNECELLLIQVGASCPIRLG